MAEKVTIEITKDGWKTTVDIDGQVVEREMKRQEEGLFRGTRDGSFEDDFPDEPAFVEALEQLDLMNIADYLELFA